MSDTPTPETNAVWQWFKGDMELLQDAVTLSRKLERERNTWEQSCYEAERERDEGREENAKLRDIAERAIDCVTCNDDLIWLMEELKQLKECVITPKETHEVYLWKDGQYVKEGKK